MRGPCRKLNLKERLYKAIEALMVSLSNHEGVNAQSRLIKLPRHH